VTASLPLTAVRLLHRPERADAWLRFGDPVRIRRRGRDGLALFAPGQVFAYVDWRANAFGTVHWLLAILRAGDANTPLLALSGIRPGAEALLAVRRKADVARAFAAIDAVEAAGVDPVTVDPAYWLRIANRIDGRERGHAGDDQALAFDLAAHRAANARRGLLP